MALDTNGLNEVPGISGHFFESPGGIGRKKAVGQSGFRKPNPNAIVCNNDSLGKSIAVQ
jgi:hypothetical protein